MDLITRVAAAQATIDKFYGEDFHWGTADCGVMVDYALRQLGFIKTPADEIGNYTTELGAIRAIKRAGFGSMEDILDSMGFERIAPAAALPGDIVGFPGGTEEKPWTALGVAIDHDRVLGFVPQTGRCEWGPFSVCNVAWRAA